MTVLSNDEIEHFEKAYDFFFLKKGHTVFFKNADDGITHMLLYLGCTD